MNIQPLKFNIKKKSLIMGSVAIAAIGIILATSFVVYKKIGTKVQEKETETAEDIIVSVASGNTELSAGFANDILGFATGSYDDSYTGKLEVSKGMAEKFDSFCEKLAEAESLEDALSAAMDELEITMKLEPEKEESVISGYEVLGVAKIGNGYLNVRKGPGTSYKRVGTMTSYSACEILETTDNGWYKIKSGEVEGYVLAKYILTGTEANEAAKEKMGTYVTKLPTAEKFEEIVVTTNNNSNKTNTNKYSSKDFASGDQSVPQKVKDLIDYALQFLGNPYKYGGNSLTTGTDCSGFTKLVFEHFGYTLERTSASQVSAGRKVPLSEVKPGDLLFYKYNGKIGHVAIYIGSGKIIHASTPKGGIKISNALFTTPACAVRVIE